MLEQRSNLDRHGKLLIPYQIRKELNYNIGDSFIIRIVNNEMHIVSLTKILDTAQNHIRNKVADTSGLLNEFLTSRQMENKLEDRLNRNNDNIE